MTDKIHSKKVTDSEIPKELREIIPEATQVLEEGGSKRPDHYLLLASAPPKQPSPFSAPSIFAPVKKILDYYRGNPAPNWAAGDNSMLPDPFRNDPWFDPRVSSKSNGEFLKILTGKDRARREIALEYLAGIYGTESQAVFHSLESELSQGEFQILLGRKAHTPEVAKLLEGLETQMARQGIAKIETGKTPTALERRAMANRLPIDSEVATYLATEPYPETFHILAKGRRAYRAPKTKNTLDFPWFYRHGDDPSGLLKNPPTSRIDHVQPNQINPRVWHGMTAHQRRAFMDSLRGVRVAKVIAKRNNYWVSAATGFALKLWESGDKSAFLKAVAAAPEGLEDHLPKGGAKYLAHHLGTLVREMKASGNEWSADEAILTAKILRHHLADNIGDDPENLVLAVQRLVKSMIRQLPATPQNVGTAVGVVLGALFLHVKHLKASDEASIEFFKTLGTVLGAIGGSYGKAFKGAVTVVVTLGLYKVRDHRELVAKLRGGMEWNWTKPRPVPMEDPRTGELRSDPNFGLIAARRVDALLHLLSHD